MRRLPSTVMFLLLAMPCPYFPDTVNEPLPVKVSELLQYKQAFVPSSSTLDDASAKIFWHPLGNSTFTFCFLGKLTAADCCEVSCRPFRINVHVVSASTTKLPSRLSPSTKHTACLPYWKMLDHAEGTPFGSADATAAMKHLSPQDFCGSGRLFHADALHGDVVRITPTGVRDFILQAMGTGKYQNRDLRKTIVMSVNIVP